MPDTPLSPYRTAAPIALIALGAAGVMLSGCAGSGGGSSASASKSAAFVAADAFVDPAPPSSAPAPALAGGSPAAPSPSATAAAAKATPSPRPMPPRPAPAPPAPDPDAALSTTARVGSPTPAANSAPASDRPVVLEALVGQVNGRAVFASEIIEPLDAQLRARSQELAAQRKPRTEFRNEAAQLINGELMRVIRDELVLAEARASLTPEQRQKFSERMARMEERRAGKREGRQGPAERSDLYGPDATNPGTFANTGTVWAIGNTWSSLDVKIVTDGVTSTLEYRYGGNLIGTTPALPARLRETRPAEPQAPS